jgi:endo-1,4-beta-xylanase
MTVKGKKAILKAKILKKSNKTLKVTSVLSINNPIGALKYVKKKGNKKISINKKNGKVKVGKKLKKGTYKVTVAVTAAGDANHNAVTKKVKFKVIVK